MRIDAAILDPQLLGAGLGHPETWRPWLSILKATLGHSEFEGFEVIQTIETTHPSA